MYLSCQSRVLNLKILIKLAILLRPYRPFWFYWPNLENSGLFNTYLIYYNFINSSSCLRFVNLEHDSTRAPWVCPGRSLCNLLQSSYSLSVICHSQSSVLSFCFGSFAVIQWRNPKVWFPTSLSNRIGKTRVLQRFRLQSMKLTQYGSENLF